MRTRVTWPDGYFATYDYNYANEMIAVREYGASSGVGVLAAYAYDDLGRITAITRGNGAASTYGYDAASRLSSLMQDFPGKTQDNTITLTYNAVGQIVSSNNTNGAFDAAIAGISDTTYVVNALNQLTSVAGQTFQATGAAI